MLDGPGQESIRRKLTLSCPQSPERLANGRHRDASGLMIANCLISRMSWLAKSGSHVMLRGKTQKPRNGVGKTLAFTLGAIHVAAAEKLTLFLRVFIGCRRRTVPGDPP